jgi:hypothetical protein
MLGSNRIFQTYIISHLSISNPLTFSPQSNRNKAAEWGPAAQQDSRAYKSPCQATIQYHTLVVDLNHMEEGDAVLREQS